MNDRLQPDKLSERFRTARTVSRKELKEFYRALDPGLRETTFRWMLHDLRASGLIASVDRGRYAFCRNGECSGDADTASLEQRPLYRPFFSKDCENVARTVHHQFPGLETCVWSTAWLHEFMLHQPTRHFLVVECERDGLESVFDFLKTRYYQVYLEPSRAEVRNYVLDAEKGIVVRRLITQSPTSRMGALLVPRLEKILVDLLADRELFVAFQGEELIGVCRNTFRTYRLSLGAMRRYALRRSCADRLSEMLVTIGITTPSHEVGT